MICAQSERYRNITAGISEIQTFFRQHRVSIVIGQSRPVLFSDINIKIKSSESDRITNSLIHDKKITNHDPNFSSFIKKP